MIKEIFANIVFVKGKRKSAIYNFNDKKVYSINENGTKIIAKYLENKDVLDDNEKQFINQIKDLLKISDMFNKDYFIPSKREKKLNTVWLEVTQRCTHKCLHCYEGKEHCEVSEPITFEKWKEVLDDIKKLECNHIQFIGGEPTLYKKLPELIYYANSIGIENISIFTNLYIITNDLLRAILDNNVTVNFSIYGYNSITHDKITQIPGSFYNLEKNLKILLNNNVNVSAHIVCMKENEGAISKTYDFVGKLGIKNTKYDEVREVFGGCQSQHLVQNSKLVRRKPNFETTKTYFDFACKQNTCWYGKCVVSTDGSIYPCEFERNIIYGNVNFTKLLDIINAKEIDKYWFKTFDEVQGCKECEYRFACKDCRPLAFANTGDMNAKNPRCKYNSSQGVWEE